MRLTRSTPAKVCLVTGCAALFLLVSFVPQGGGRSPSGVFSPQNAVAGEFKPGGFGDRQLLGLFSESVTNNWKGKVNSSQWGSVRNSKLFCRWNEIQPYAKTSYNWTKMDREVNDALSLGINSILLTIAPPTPTWAQNTSNPYPKWMGPPKRIDDWGDFCGAVANRYKGYVDYYQIWNEPGWDSNAQAAKDGVIYLSGDCEYTYLGLLRSAYQKIKKVNPQAYVIAGSLMQGLTRSGDNFTPYDTLMKGANQDVSMKIDSNKNIVAERPMYFNYQGRITDGTVELGTTKPGRTWFLAEGATHPGFDEWICIQNPNATKATVRITYMFPGGTTQEKWVSVGPNTRFTESVNADVGPNKDVSARVDSDIPVCVERPMYFKYRGSIDGGSIASGVPQLSKVWYLAEGATQPGFEEWISLMNPGSAGTEVTITYMFPGGATQVQKLTMPPTSRETVMVNNVVGPNKDVSAKIEANNPIIAERPMYFNYHGAWTGGHSQYGAVAPNKSWFLSEGTTRNNGVDGAFEEWISIQNPGDKEANVSFKYMFPGGGVQAASKKIPAHARETILVNDVVGKDKDVSVQLDSDQAVVVERPQYFNYHNWCTGGDVELGCTASSPVWYFAEGTTRSGFDEWVTLQNPNAAAADARITFMFSDGTTQEKWINLPAHSRTTVSVNEALSMGNVSDAFAIHPYDYPEWWAWYTQAAMNICAKYPSGKKEMTVTEIGWPHAGRDEFSAEGQREAIDGKGIGSLWGVGVRKIWVFEDLDPAKSWDDAFSGLFDFNGNPMPAWNEYKKWQNQLPNYGNKPNHLP
jgi:hypothetical protein